jgi:hypothetical protein
MLNQVLRTKEEVMNVAVELKQDLMSVLYGSYIVELEDYENECRIILSDKNSGWTAISQGMMKSAMEVIRIYDKVYRRSFEWYVNAKVILDGDRVKAYPIVEMTVKAVKEEEPVNAV